MICIETDPIFDKTKDLKILPLVFYLFNSSILILEFKINLGFYLEINIINSKKLKKKLEKYNFHYQTCVFCLKLLIPTQMPINIGICFRFSCHVKGECHYIKIYQRFYCKLIFLQSFNSEEHEEKSRTKVLKILYFKNLIKRVKTVWVQIEVLSVNSIITTSNKH